MQCAHLVVVNQLPTPLTRDKPPPLIIPSSSGSSCRHSSRSASFAGGWDSSCCRDSCHGADRTAASPRALLAHRVVRPASAALHCAWLEAAASEASRAAAAAGWCSVRRFAAQVWRAQGGRWGLGPAGRKRCRDVQKR